MTPPPPTASISTNATPHLRSRQLLKSPDSVSVSSISSKATVSSSKNSTASLSSSPLWVVIYLGVGVLLGKNYGEGKVHVANKQHSTPNNNIFDALIVPVYAFLVVLYLTTQAYCEWIVTKSPKSTKSLPPSNGLTSRIESKERSNSKLIEPSKPAPVPANPTGKVDLTGKFQLVSNCENYENFLAAQGVPWALRKAANKARPQHCITHNHNDDTVAIQIKGLIESTTTYCLDGTPTPCVIRGRNFEDTATYLPENDGIQVKKRAVNEGYTIFVRRRLSKDLQHITLTSLAVFDDPSKPDVESKQLFDRIQEGK